MIDLIKKFLLTHPVLNECIDTSKKISKGYFKNNLWRSSRCRIDVSLFADVILDYILTSKRSVLLTEKYLEITRAINKNDKKYKKSNGQDVSALVKWFQIKKMKIDHNNINFEALSLAVNDYIKFVIENNKHVPDNLRTKYYNYITSQLNDNSMYPIHYENNYSETKINIEDIVSTNKYWSKKIIYNIAQNNSTIIGECGEEISYIFLCSKFGKENVDWVSKKNKYSDHDFEVNFNNQIYYIETKSTTKPVINFYLSINEYSLYKENKDNYWLLFITNINLNKEQKPIIKLIENPSFEIMMDEYGYDKNNKIFKIMPTKFIG